jgi:peptidoglycan/LPS O-acetylase OafA/YrhL
MSEPGNIDIFNFYARRIFRLMPRLFVTLAIAYGLTYAGLLPGGITVRGLAAQLLYFANTTPYFSMRATRFHRAQVSFGRSRSRSTSTFC